jgi:hypothetical protein
VGGDHWAPKCFDQARECIILSIYACDISPNGSSLVLRARLRGSRERFVFSLPS